jgi:hypothetical protein
MAYYQGTLSARGPSVSSREVKYRFMPPDVALRTYRTNRDFYDKLLKSRKPKESQAPIKSSVLLISGCQDNQLSADGDFNGLFTAQLLRVWKSGAFNGSYKKFHAAIVRRMPPDQTPNYFRAGQINPQFESQRPFTI